MNKFMEAGRLLHLGAKAQAQWDIEVSNRIFRSRKRMLVLGLLLVPIIAGIIGGFAYAESLPSVLGNKDPYAPAFYSLRIFLITIGVGVTAGLITGCIGAGGGFVITPALMSVGIRGILAVGTDLFHIFAKAIMGSVLHRKLGNISYVLAIAFLVGSIAGATGGGYINRTLYEANPVLSDAFITIVYAVMLGFLGAYALMDFFRSRRNAKEASRTLEDHEVSELRAKDEIMTGFADKLQKVKVPPMVHFDQGVVPGGRKISAIFVVIVGAFVGLAASIMGVGGGFLTFPIFVYGMGVSSATSVGTDIFQIVFTAGYSSFTQYAIYGFVFYTLALGMLLGSILGVQVGSLVTKVVSGSVIRGFYALAILAGFTNRVFALPSKLTKLDVVSIPTNVNDFLNNVGTVVFFGVIIVFSFWVFKSFITNIPLLKGEGSAKQPPSGMVPPKVAIEEE